MQDLTITKLSLNQECNFKKMGFIIDQQCWHIAERNKLQGYSYPSSAVPTVPSERVSSTSPQFVPGRITQFLAFSYLIIVPIFIHPYTWMVYAWITNRSSGQGSHNREKPRSKGTLSFEVQNSKLPRRMPQLFDFFLPQVFFTLR